MNNDSQFVQSENNQTLILHSVAPPRSESTFAISIIQNPLPVYRDTSVVESQKHLKLSNEEELSSLISNQSLERPVYALIWIAGSEDPGIDSTLSFIGRISLLRQYFESKRPPEPIVWQQKPRMKCKVRSKHILEDSFSAFMKTDPEKLKLRLNVLFYGEDAVDYGGISREWFTLILPEITNPNYALFKGGGYVDKIIFNISENDPSGLMLDFTLTITEFDQMKEIELKPNGKDIEVTQENKKEYIKFVIKHKLTYNIVRQLREIQKGFHDLLPQGCLKAFTPAELEIMLCGVDQIDLEDWKANTDYIGGYRSNSPQILYFWDMILDMSNEQRAQLLQFATGTTLLPPGGFMNLMGSMGPRKFTIYRSTKGTQYLPNVHICFNQNDLPYYETNDIFIEMFNTVLKEESNDQLTATDSDLDEIDPNDPTTIDRTAVNGYPHADLMNFVLDSLFQTRARFVHRLEEFPDPFGPVGDPSTKHIQPPPIPTSELQPSRFSEHCFALSIIVVSGSSDSGISVLERLAFAKSRFFSSLTLVSPQCLPCLESTIIPPPAFYHQHFVEPYPNGMSVMGVTKQIKLKQLQKDQPDAELEEDFEESQYQYFIGYDVCDEDETLLKIDIDITSDEYKEFVKRKKERAAFLRQVYEQKVYSQHRLLHPIPVPPIIARAAGIPGTQEIVPIPPLWSAKVDPQREKDIQIEFWIMRRNINLITNTTSAPIGSLITNQPGFISKVPEYIQQPDSSFHQIITKKKGSIIPSIPGNIPATEYPASFISVTPSTHHSLFVIPIPFRPPTPEIQVVNSCNYTAATLAGLGLQRYIEEVPGVVLNIDREKRELMLADGSLVPYDMLIISIEQYLSGISPSACECFQIGDIRAGDVCPLTEDCKEVEIDPTYRGCFCTDIYQPDFCTCTSAIHPDNEQGCVCDENEDATFNIDDCIETKTCTGNNTPIGCNCADNGSILNRRMQKLIIASSGWLYTRCACTQDSKDLIGVPVAQCEFRTIGDPRSGLTTPVVHVIVLKMIIQIKPNTCKYIDRYTPNGCTCPRDTFLNQLEGVPPGQCKCLDEDDPRVGISCPISRKCSSEDLQSTPCQCSADFNQSGSICTYQRLPQNCVCDLIGKDPFNFATCQETKVCTANQQPNPSCTCSYSVENCRYSKSQCQADKIYPTLLNWTEEHEQSVCPDIFKCSKDYSPWGCNCYVKTGVSYELDFALNNLRSIKLESNVQITTISLLKEYLNSYAFIDTSLNPSDKINILRQKFYDNNKYVDVEGTYPALEAIARWADEEEDLFSKAIFDVIDAFTNNSSHDYSKRLLIDLRGNVGGQFRLGRQFLNFLNPNVGHHLYQTVDMTRTDLNELIAIITLYQQDIYPDEVQLPLELDKMEIDKLFYSRENRKSTTQYEGKNSLTVNMTYITCSQFVKHIGEKHLGRIIGVGAPYPDDKDIRFDVGMTTSGSIYNYQSVQDIKSNASLIESAKIDEFKLPNQFYRIGTDLSWSNKGGYGFTDESSDQLLEYKIVDVDFRVEYFPIDSLISDDDDDDEKRYILYDEVLKREKELQGIGNKSSSQYISASNKESIHKSNSDSKSKSSSNPDPLPTSPKKCLSWEVETNNTQTPNNCKGCLRNDPYSICGHPCSVRGSSEAKGRYSNGTAKIGEYLTDKCIFSHCKVGYYRQNIVFGQKIDQKCSLVPLGPNQIRIEITPDQTEDEVKDNDPCNLQVIVDELVELEEEEEQQQQQSDQDKQKEIETEEPKSKAEMISGIVVAGVIVVASIVAMIIVAVVIQHQKYSGLGRRGQQLISVDA
ncbi:MAG: putative E3 ubiquitin-protein ligase SMURF1 [Streblomastix strix]|uniref:HECT-type E3 ubiquitin transferase n=2 Tax=Streblomastix strix TaxID=222440 RepID=A0A5J4X5I8_9EUKA|nr:MAG: putative E3 ubiquitin-protein ligase SMURF1 [Streblomastix strix]